MDFRRLVYSVLVEWFNQATAADFDEICWLLSERLGRSLNEQARQRLAGILSDLLLVDALVREGQSYFCGAFFSEVCCVSL